MIAVVYRHEERYRHFPSCSRFTSSERTYPRPRNLRFIDEVAWFRLEGAPSNPKGKEDKLALFTTTLHKGTITNRDSRRDISIDRADVIPWTSRRRQRRRSGSPVKVFFSVVVTSLSPRHVGRFYFKSVARCLDGRCWIYKEGRWQVFRANLFAE